MTGMNAGGSGIIINRLMQLDHRESFLSLGLIDTYDEVL